MSDEEKMGFKALYVLAGPLQLRILPTPESSHPMWNDFINATTAANLKSTLLKCTLLVNWGQGPFGSGTHQCRLSEAATHLMEVAPDWYLEEMNDNIAADRGIANGAGVSRAEWINTCQKRIVKVPRQVSFRNF